MKKFMILDIGCGDCPCGDVNIDIYKVKKLPRYFVIASAENLPFKDNSFDVARSSYVIEHCLRIEQLIKEHLRVVRKKVVIVTDNIEWIGDISSRLMGVGRHFHEEHCYAWTKEYLENLIKKMQITEYKVKLCNLRPTLKIKILSKFALNRMLERFFLRDIYVEIEK